MSVPWGMPYSPSLEVNPSLSKGRPPLWADHPTKEHGTRQPDRCDIIHPPVNRMTHRCKNITLLIIINQVLSAQVGNELFNRNNIISTADCRAQLCFFYCLTRFCEILCHFMSFQCCSSTKVSLNLVQVS